MTPVIQGYIREAEAAFKTQSASLAFRKTELKQRHQDERKRLEDRQKARWNQEAFARAQRFSRGFRGVWDRLSGKHARIRGRNEYETYQALLRDRAEKESVIVRQLDERQELQQGITTARDAHAKEMAQFHEDVAHYMRMEGREALSASEHFREADQGRDDDEAGRHISRGGAGPQP
jgi:hypothetical protein